MLIAAPALPAPAPATATTLPAPPATSKHILHRTCATGGWHYYQCLCFGETFFRKFRKYLRCLYGFVKCDCVNFIDSGHFPAHLQLNRRYSVGCLFLWQSEQKKLHRPAQQPTEPGTRCKRLPFSRIGYGRLRSR